MSPTSILPAGAPETVAAVDLGSNSFHMVVAQLAHGQLQVLDRLRERVALAEGLDADKRLREKAQERALACLQRFAQRLRDLPHANVRAVGTSSLRQARNASAFLARAQETLGHPIEVVPGREEARLIYLGVSHMLETDDRRRLVVDVGGGSTECILGEGFEPVRTDSLHMGCVNYSLRYFEGGAITRERMRQAEIAAALELQPIARLYRNLGWDECVGSSGTILSIEEILRASDWSDGGITEKGLAKLGKALVAAGSVDNLALAGMSADRAPVLAGGYAILSAVFASLSIERMLTSQGALREGVLYDLIGRIRHEDVRDETIRGFMQRYAVDREQAGRVERTALYCYERAASAWELGPDERRLLSWAARLHEIGLSVNYSGYHKHGAYLVTWAEMPGFSREDRELLAALIHTHRRKLARAVFDAMGAPRAALAMRLAALLRVAVRLNRSRSTRSLPAFGLAAKRSALELEFPPGWLEAHPLTRADLEEEALSLRGIELELAFR